MNETVSIAGSVPGGAAARLIDSVTRTGATSIGAGLSRRHLGKVAALGRTKRFPARTSIVTAGTNADAFYVILDGRATVRAGQRRIPLATGDYFGEMALLDGGVRSASVVADTEVLVMAIPRRGFLKLLESEPKIAISIMGTLANRVRMLQATTNV